MAAMHPCRLKGLQIQRSANASLQLLPPFTTDLTPLSPAVGHISNSSHLFTSSTSLDPTTMPAAVSIPPRDQDSSQHQPASSPMSYKTTLGVPKSFRAGLSPYQGFSHLENSDYKLSSSMTGSVESESSRLMKLLSASQSRASGKQLGDYLQTTQSEQEFCRDFTCCGAKLNDLHALVEHFEDVHVRVVPSEYPFPIAGLGASTVIPDVLPAPAGVDPDDMEMDDDAPSPTSSNTPPHTPVAHPPAASAFDTTSVFLPYRRPSDLGPAAYYNNLSSMQRSHSTGPHLNGPGIQPALLTRAPEEITPILPATGTSSNLKVTVNGSRRVLTGPILPNAASDPRPPLPGGKPFRCPTPNCTKSYKQANGLKYHLTHGQCSFLPPDPVLENLTDKEADERLRPFVCAVGTGPDGKGGGCGRRYKNMNGLRYHYQHSGAHGAAGLTMLASNTHPPPPAWAMGGASTLSRSNSIQGSGESPSSTPLTSRPGSSAGNKSTPGSSHAPTEEDFDGDEDMEMEFEMS